MAWVCKNCNSNNSDSLNECEVCGCSKRFVARSAPSALSGTASHERPPAVAVHYGGPRHSSYTSGPRRVAKTVAKVFSILLPVLSFLFGQHYMYVFFLLDGLVPVVSLIFSEISLAVLIISTIFGTISIVHVIVRSWKLADLGSILNCWMYIIISSLCFFIVPCLAGYAGIIITSAISHLSEEHDGESIPYFPAFISCVVGIVLMFGNYVKTGNVFILTKLIAANDWKIPSMEVLLVIVAVINIIATFKIAARASDMDNAADIYFTLIPFCFTLLFMPAAGAVFLLIYSLIIPVIDKRCSINIGIVVIIYIAVVVAVFIALSSLGNKSLGVGGIISAYLTAGF